MNANNKNKNISDLNEFQEKINALGKQKTKTSQDLQIEQNDSMKKQRLAIDELDLLKENVIKAGNQKTKISQDLLINEQNIEENPITTENINVENLKKENTPVAKEIKNEAKNVPENKELTNIETKSESQEQDVEKKEPKIPTYYDTKLARYKSQIELNNKTWSIPQSDSSKKENKGLWANFKNKVNEIVSKITSPLAINESYIKSLVEVRIKELVNTKEYKEIKDEGQKNKITKKEEKKILEEIAKTCLLCLNEGCNYNLFEKVKNLSIKVFKGDVAGKNFGQIVSQTKDLIDRFNIDNPDNKISWSMMIKDLGGDRDYVIDACKNISTNHTLNVFKESADVFYSSLQQEKIKEKLTQFESCIDSVEKATEVLRMEKEKTESKLKIFHELEKDGNDFNGKINKNEEKLKRITSILTSEDKSLYTNYFKEIGKMRQEKINSFSKVDITKEIDNARKNIIDKKQPSFSR